MITNIVILSVVLITNANQAIVGESQGKALVASQETIVQRTITLEDVVLRSAVTTNAVGFAFAKPPPSPAVTVESPTNVVTLTTNDVRLSRSSEADVLRVPITNRLALNTNSPALRRRLEREQRLRPPINAPPALPK